MTLEEIQKSLADIASLLVNEDRCADEDRRESQDVRMLRAIYKLGILIKSVEVARTTEPSNYAAP